MSLLEYGWTDAWAELFGAAGIPAGRPARVTAEYRDVYHVFSDDGAGRARVAGRMRHAASGHSELPVVGDWVVVTGQPGVDCVIQEILPRMSVFLRKQVGDGMTAQVIAANVDVAWVVASLDTRLNPARIERYVTLVWNSGAVPVIVLTKADRTDHPEATVTEVTGRIPGVSVHAVSCTIDLGLHELRRYLTVGHTVALLGPSGVGKSTLVNHLAGADVVAVGNVRAYDNKGRHTTTHRELVLLPSGGLVLDTPGLRMLQPWVTERDVRDAFHDIDELAGSCRFTDCRHESEPACAVLAAIESGRLDIGRLESYRKQKREMSYIFRKVDARAASEEKRRIKNIMKAYRRHMRGDS